MADTKFSGATAVTVVDDTDVFPLAAGGTASRKITGANLKTAMMAVHIADTSAAHAASAISADSTTLVGMGTDVQAVLEELDNGIADHLADSSAAHAASAISVDSTTLEGTGTDVQAVFEELDNSKSNKLLVENVQTDSYTLVLGDADLVVVGNKGTAMNLTVPLNSSVAYSTGTVIALHQRGAGQVTVVATGGVTINSPSGKLKLTGQYSSAALRKYGTDTWVLTGDIAA